MRRRRTPAAWLALLGLALHAFWPLIAQARPDEALLVPICTVQGVTHYLEVPGGHTPLDDSANAQHDHCAYCFPATVQAHAPLHFAARIGAARLERGATQGDHAASILMMDARGPPFSPLLVISMISMPRRENAQTHRRHAGALAAVAGGGFLRVGVLLG